MAIDLFVALLLTQAAPASAPDDDTARTELAELEAASHQSWLERDHDALRAVMAPEFHFVVMNGALETRAEILGEGMDVSARGPSPLSVRRVTVQPQQVMIRGTTATVISIMDIDASVRGRPLPPRMRVLSVFSREDDDNWMLLARSITPILQPVSRSAAMRIGANPHE